MAKGRLRQKLWEKTKALVKPKGLLRKKFAEKKAAASALSTVPHPDTRSDSGHIIKSDAVSNQILRNINSETEIALKADLDTTTRYSLTSPTISGTNTIQLNDRSINAVTLGNNSYTLVFPTKIDGKARDFFIRLTITSEEIPQITFEEPDGSSVSFDVADDSWAEIQQGVNLIMFTETAQ